MDLKSYFMTSTMIISFPTSVKVFSWLFSLFLNVNRSSVSLYCFSLFIFFFSLGGVSGLMLSNSLLDVFLHDTYFVVGHFHFVLASASILGFLSGMFLLFDSLFVGVNKEMINKVVVLFSSSFSFFLMVLFVPFHVLGLVGMPRRVMVYPFVNFL